MNPRKNILSKMAQGVSNIVSPAISNIKSKIVNGMMPATASAATISPSRITQAPEGYQYNRIANDSAGTNNGVYGFNDITPSGVRYQGRITAEPKFPNGPVGKYAAVSIDSPTDPAIATSTLGDRFYLNDSAPVEYTPQQKQEIYDQIKAKGHRQSGYDFSPYTMQNTAYDSDPYHFSVYGGSDPTATQINISKQLRNNKNLVVKKDSKGEYVSRIKK